MQDQPNNGHLATLVPFPREGFVSKQYVARYFDVCERTVERWQRAGCPHIRAGRHQNSRVRFRLSEVAGWLERA